MAFDGKRAAPRDILKQKGSEQEKQDLEAIEDTKFELRIFKTKADSSLEDAVYKAREAIEKNNVTARQNAFFDIRLALKIRKIAYGLESALGRMESVLRARQSMTAFGQTAAKLSRLVKRQPSFSVNKLAGMYEKTLGMISDMSGKMNRFSVASMGIPLTSEDMSISDQEIEKLVRGEINADALGYNAQKQPAGRELTHPEDGSPAQEDVESYDNLLRELEALSGSEQSR